MRLITKNLWRAFPELDRFDDERCQRFIQSARRGKGAILGRFLLNIILSAAVFVIIAAIGLLIMWAFWQDPSGSSGPAAGGWRFGLGLFIVCIAIAASGIASLILRDQLLRRRVANFIHARGKCPQCRYILLGIRVPESLRVNCPECGLELEVDEALTELADPTLPDTPTAADQTNTPPRTSSQPPGQRERRLARAPEDRGILPAWFTPKRRKRALRALLAAAAIALAITASIWGYNWWFLQDQARRAAAQRIGLTGIDKISESLNPPPDGNKDAWDYFDLAVQLRAQAETEVANANPDLMSAMGAEAYPEYAFLYDEPPQPVEELGERDQERKRTQEGQAEYARKMIDQMGELGAWDLLDSMCAAPRAFRAAPPLDPKEPPDLGMLSLTECRKIAQINAARMALAAARADHAEVCRALRVSISLGRIIRRKPSMVHWLVADSLETLAWRTLRKSLQQVAGDLPLDSAQAILEAAADDTPPISTVLNAEREYQRDYTRWFFSDPARVKQGWPTYPWSGTLEEEVETGTLDESLAAIDTVFDLYIADLARHPSERSTARYKEFEKIGATSGCEMVLRWLTMADTGSTRRRAAVLNLAIERYRARHGHPPETLEHLVPGFLKTIPTDPLARDGDFRYRTVPPPNGTGTPPDYILYSVGADANDNGGSADDAYPEGALSPHASPGQDYIIHRPATPEDPPTPDPAP